MTTAAPERSAAVETCKLEVSHVSKSFHNGGRRLRALDDVSLRVLDGEIVCLVGPSGCGKSTLLNLVAGLEKPDAGSILFDGRPIAGPGSDRMMMFQESALFPWLDVLGNVLFGLELIPSLTRAERLDSAREHLKLVGLERFERSAVHQLSGGMKQRVALARALAPRPRMLLMDEPFAALDALTREQLYADLQDIARRERQTMLFVTHNVREAVCLGDRVVLFSANPGAIRETFDVALPRPRDMNSVDLARHAGRVMQALRAHLAPAPEDPE